MGIAHHNIATTAHIKRADPDFKRQGPGIAPTDPVKSLEGIELLILQLQNSVAFIQSTQHGIIGATAVSVLVIAKDKVESVKQIVNQIRSNGGCQILTHNRVYRPWGWYERLSEGDRFQVKSLMVRPGKKKSFQKNVHRSEHWVVVKGTVEVTLGEKISVLNENQSTFIPRGVVHRLHNPGRFPAYLIEVQSGNYLGEDDIERIEDDFNRLDVE